MSTPRTLYARSRDIHLAYQVIGDGPRDVVLVLDWASHLEAVWEQPFIQEFTASVNRYARVLWFDMCGGGLSDRVDQVRRSRRARAEGRPRFVVALRHQRLSPTRRRGPIGSGTTNCHERSWQLQQKRDDLARCSSSRPRSTDNGAASGRGFAARSASPVSVTNAVACRVSANVYGPGVAGLELRVPTG